MLILSNENNTSTLKLIISAKIAKENVDVKIVKKSDEGIPSPCVFPTFYKVPEVYIFSNNAACVYLLSGKNSDAQLLECSQWLEWEATRLVPSVANLQGPKPLAAEASRRLAQLLTELNKQLQGKQFILGNKPSAVDISVWCTLYSVYNNGDLTKQFLSDASSVANINSWNAKFCALPGVKEALEEYAINTAVSSQVLNTTSVTGAYVLPSPASSSKGSADVTSSSHGSSPDQKPEVAVTEEEINAAADFWNSGHQKLRERLPDEKVVLPKEGYKNILITSALPYVNNVPHLGNIIGCVLSADVFARYCRLCNYNTLFVCGTDEYGTATETKALEEKLTPRQICDKYFEIHNSVYRWFRIGFDYFGRTTTPEQTEIAQKMFLDLYKNGFVETQTVEQLLCEGCNRFLADRFVEGTCPHPGCGYEDARGDQCDGCGKLVNATELISPRCKLCCKAPVLRESAHFFLDLPQLEPLLQTWVASSEAGWSNSAQQITRAWLKTGLKTRCITRDLSWGVPVPVDGFRNKVFYVWFDAPIGYISITKRYTDQYEKWWKPDPKHNVTLYQFMAKDNVPFHSVVFPATLLGIGQKNVMVKHIMATEYLNYEDGKFSKSRGVGVFGSDAQDTGIPSDVFRFYLVSIRPEGQDANFSWHDLATRNNSELLNNLGNFANRGGVFCANHFAGRVPSVVLGGDEVKLLALVNREIGGYVESMEACKQRDALRHVMNISRLGNQYMQAQQPWVLLKGDEQAKARAATVVGLSCNMSCLLAVLLKPFMPETSQTLLTQLGTKLEDVGQLNPEFPMFRILLRAGHRIGSPAPLFQKIEAALVEDLKRRYAGRQSSPPKEVVSANLTPAQLEKKILEQGEKVRKLKAGGVEKAVWQPEVQVLLALKKQLEVAGKAPTGDGNKASSGSQTVAEIEDEIAKQGEKVRKLKASGVEKSVWQPEVQVLLALKKQLGSMATATSVKQASTAGENKENVASQSVAEIEEEVAKQGEKVRTLKAGGGDKSSWQPEVEKLLVLKKRLTDAQKAAGITPPVEPKVTKNKKSAKPNK